MCRSTCCVMPRRWSCACARAIGPAFSEKARCSNGCPKKKAAARKTEPPLSMTSEAKRLFFALPIRAVTAAARLADGLHHALRGFEAVRLRGVRERSCGLTEVRGLRLEVREVCPDLGQRGAAFDCAVRDEAFGHHAGERRNVACTLHGRHVVNRDLTH